MTTPVSRPAADALIEDLDQLVDWFASACVPPERWRVGLEHEKFGVLRETGKAIGYGGTRGIQRVLELFIERHGWSPVFDGENVIALTHEGASITLEPGGQLELSGTPYDSVHEICTELQVHLRHAKSVGDSLDIDWIGLGAHPSSTPEEIEWMPKPRYAIMGRYLPTRGRHAVDMMKRTCTIQASFDFSDEADCAQKMRLAMGLSPVVTAIFANSPIDAGEYRGFMSERIRYWQQTDHDRCGLFPEVFEEGWGFKDYVDRVLRTPMFFIKREDRLIDYSGRSFRQFIERGLDGHRARIADFELHLSTLFPEARLKRVIEVRGADAGRPDTLCALPALWKGILYDTEARQKASTLASTWTVDDRSVLWTEVATRALDAEVQGVRLLEVAQELFRVSRDGLKRQACVSQRGNDESWYLEPIEEMLFGEERCRAAELLDLWNGPWNQDVFKLLEHTRY